MMEFLFYLTALLCAYSYFLYPLILMLLPARSTQFISVIPTNKLPRLSLIITAHNEESRIREKLENTLQIDYPKKNLEVIVASDFSNDATDSMVESYAAQNIKLVRTGARHGKEYAQLCAIRAAQGEILVFSDVATQIPTNAFRLLVNCFADNSVGAVSSQDQFISNDGKVVGEGAYLKYEMWLRRLESERAGLVGLSGSFFAARREVCEQWDIYSPSDFNMGFNCARRGKVAITCPEVFGLYRDVKNPGLEYRRKMRTVVRGITAITRHPEVLNPLCMGMFSFQIWSHKILRWAVPWFMLAFASVTLAQLGQGIIYQQALVLQLVFYALALAGWLSPWLRENMAVRIIFYFVQTNLALAQATLMFISGTRMTMWTPSQR